MGLRILLIIWLLVVGLARPVFLYSYSNGMAASVVIGQTDFVSNASGTTREKLSTVVRGIHVDPQGRLIVSDTNNSRVLVWNHVPTTNGVLPDLVLGQANFESVSPDRGGSMAANTLDGPTNVYSDGNKLFVADRNNDRILIWNSFPTQNGQAADVVLGSSSFTSDPSDACTSSVFADIYGLTVFDGKLFMVDRTYNRILIWNAIPTSNGAAADVVMGQPDMTSCSALSISDKSLSDARGISVDPKGRVFVADRGRQRVLIWNTVPTTNYVSADVVVGQTNFTNSGASVTASGFGSLLGMHSDGERLYVVDGSTGGGNRVLIYNYIPNENGMSADIVLGQTNFTDSSINMGGSTSAIGLRGPIYADTYQNKLLVIDEGNNRLLIYNNEVKQPVLSLNNDLRELANGVFRAAGRASVDSPYVISKVEYSINGGGMLGANALDGNFGESIEDYYLDFLPTDSQPVDKTGIKIPGYTFKVKVTNNNIDVTDNLFYFTPFDTISPKNGAVLNSTPEFEFSVNRQREIMRDNLSEYQIQIRKSGDGFVWETYIDDIPIDFRSVKGNRDNNLWQKYDSIDTDNGEYETSKLMVKYTQDSSLVRVRSKIGKISGPYGWRVAALDKAGHVLYTSEKTMIVGEAATKEDLYISKDFPLAVMDISGVGNPLLNSYLLTTPKRDFYTLFGDVVLRGIAYANSKIDMRLYSKDCLTECIRTYTTVTMPNSRYVMTIPRKDIQPGKQYRVYLSASLDNKYTELPAFYIGVGR